MTRMPARCCGMHGVQEAAGGGASNECHPSFNARNKKTPKKHQNGRVDPINCVVWSSLHGCRAFGARHSTTHDIMWGQTS